jgi:flavin-dependent dehydrogenase
MSPCTTYITDVFVAGGGPAGLAAAVAAAQRGFSVMVADSGRPPIDKACGEGIMPDGLAALRALGVELSHSDTAPLEGIRFIDSCGEVSARFLRGVGRGVRRTALHAALAAQAEAMDVRLAWGTRVEAISQGEAIAGGEVIRSRYIVCADGQNSCLRQTAGLGTGRLCRRRYGFRRHYRIVPWSRFVEVYWGVCGQFYVTPVGGDEICVALLTSDPHLRVETALPWFPALRRRLPRLVEADRGDLAGVTPFGRTMGGITATRRLPAVTSGRIALVGDCSGSADAITGDGLSLAFQQARALAEAMWRGELIHYQREHERISRLPRAMGELLLLLDDRPKLRSRVLRVFAESPELFAQLVAVHTRSISPAELGMKDCLHFGWRLLCA